jgi:hypothetical protein
MATRTSKLMATLLAFPLLADAPLMGTAAYGDWHTDAPGVVRHFTPDAMPRPYSPCPRIVRHR